MGKIRDVLRLPLLPAGAEETCRALRRKRGRRRRMTPRRILARTGGAARRRHCGRRVGGARGVPRAQGRAQRRHRPRRGAWLGRRLARQRLGQSRHPPRLPARPDGTERCPAARSPSIDKDTYPLRAIGPERRSPDRAGRLGDSGRLLRRPRRRVHAADVHQRRRLRGRRDDGGLPRAGGLVRADRQAGPPERRGADRRRARAGGRAAGDRSRTTAWSAATAACTRAPWSASAPCWPRGRC